jgi:hypothetical protein
VYSFIDLISVIHPPSARCQTADPRIDRTGQHPGQHAQGFDLLDVKRASPLFTGTAVDEIEDYPGQAATRIFTSIRGAEYLIAHRDESLKQTGG